MNLACPLCQHACLPYLQASDLNRGLSPEVFDYCRCPSCGLILLRPVPDRLADFYPADYYAVPASVDQLARRAEPERYKIQTVQRFASGGRLLEIGPGYGGFAYLAKQAGFEVEGVEMDARCCRFLTGVLGVPAIQSSDVRAALGRVKPCDVIALWHVIEHLPDPWGALDAAVERLAPGGLLVLATPNPGSLQFRIFGRFWAHLDAPRHLGLIPAAVLRRRLEAAGLTHLLTTARDRGAFADNHFGWEQSLRNLCPWRWAKSLLGRAGFLFRMALLPIERRGHNGSTYTAVFRKL
jgi:2-polyprenyl-3-methyl-5-hydroxy-6-metoxy-1,4-benzoquinol methylase